MKNIILLIFLVTLLYSCEKEPVLEYSTYKPIVYEPTAEENLKKFPLEILWHKRLSTEPLPDQYNVRNESKLYFDREGLAIFYDDNKYHYLNRFNGDNFINKSLGDYYRDKGIHTNLGSILSSHRKVIALDKFGNETLLYTAPDSIYIDSKNTLHRDNFYFTDSDYFKGTCSLYKLNVFTHNCELISSLDGKKLWGDDYIASIALPTFFSVNGVEYVLYNYTKSKEFDRSYTTYTSCIRISDDTEIWAKQNLYGVGQNNIIIHDNNVVLNGGGRICKVSAINGDIIWDNSFNTPGQISTNDINASGAKVFGDNLVFISNGKLMEFSMNNGTFSYSGLLIMEYYENPPVCIANGIAYYADDEDGKSFLYGMKLSDHSIVFKGMNPYYKIKPYDINVSFLSSEMIVDPNLNHGYISDGYFIYCMKLL